ncbi:MAG: hypothetical protein C6P37_00055 [Caldibacillus debilis]|uniref:Uncharacterized protein n=1 Tax=Caldibacillus debilis TaxID=301148 RepID=A0A150M8E3_9BACI|nr:hypothetical protein B4135_0234 [Caldibacillus debilis]MBY6272252.1 hypothetical protein [Bacillaceae bacterium]REJ14647.1 MAG: hypothetical protein C6W57_13715 [Caldibacillus debilis]REJ25243.1 MAG: hypothetical protein C6W56_13790 [Caldibacillus debilis]REJ31590.1 MAG: hypothetical protein C6P37_00055 [Caldibacillus debilis]
MSSLSFSQTAAGPHASIRGGFLGRRLPRKNGLSPFFRRGASLPPFPFLPPPIPPPSIVPAREKYYSVKAVILMGT